MVSSAALPFDIRPLLGDAIYLAPSSGHFERDQLMTSLAQAEALISLLSVQVDEQLLAAAPRLRVVANVAVGFDNVDIQAATRRGVAVVNTPDVLTEATADFAFALLLATARRLVEGDRTVRSRQWTGWDPGQLLGADVFGTTLGIIGMGRIGRAVARRASGFAMEILYLNHHRTPPVEASHGEGPRSVGWEELLLKSDFLSLHCPLTPETQHIIDRQALRAMKKSAILVNTARGGCVDEPALAWALAAGEIAGAGLDVFANEPAVHPDLLTSDHVVLAPHAGSATTSARKRMVEICANAVRSVLDGHRPPTLLNPEVF